MQLIGQFKQFNDARIFSDYLLVRGVEHSILAQGDLYLVFVAAEKARQSKEAFEAFILQPDDVKYRASSWQLDDQQDLSHWKADYPPLVLLPALKRIWQQAGVITQGVMLLNVGIYLLLALGFKAQIYQSLGLFQYGGGLHQLFSMQLWRLFTPMFLHFNTDGYHLHILFNLMWFWELSSLLERKLTKWQLILLILLTSLMANLAQFVASPNLFGGMSGVVFGLMGYCWIRGKLEPESGLMLNPTVVGIMLFCLILGLSGALNFMMGPMANAAHLFGLLSGMGYAYYHVASSKIEKR